MRNAIRFRMPFKIELNSTLRFTLFSAEKCNKSHFSAVICAKKFLIAVRIFLRGKK